MYLARIFLKSNFISHGVELPGSVKISSMLDWSCSAVIRTQSLVVFLQNHYIIKRNKSQALFLQNLQFLARMLHGSLWINLPSSGRGGKQKLLLSFTDSGVKNWHISENSFLLRSLLRLGGEWSKERWCKNSTGGERGLFPVTPAFAWPLHPRSVNRPVHRKKCFARPFRKLDVHSVFWLNVQPVFGNRAWVSTHSVLRTGWMLTIGQWMNVHSWTQGWPSVIFWIPFKRSTFFAEAADNFVEL